ncbi:solute carrier family 23 protein [Paenibacillus sp. JX-17]|uniref:Solute carrier family 23 protein n=1 Tax=Paenibacillus lacisoli TaxID=3064525 RepID=A0ABT9CB30_9BACL|nr:solute carrier family 23 protein [Paenibacillus sp. JX-17]MDO7906468.1 solute carrier family 23 protein [Paenibacillus sp. JX-17]
MGNEPVQNPALHPPLGGAAAAAYLEPNGSPQQQENRIRVEEKLSPSRTLLYGVQHVFVSNVWLDPLFIAAAAGLPLALASNLVNAIFIGAGLVTLLQAARLARLPIIQGPSAAFDALMISAGKAGSLAAAGGAILISALVVFLAAVTGLLGRASVLFRPVVSGTVIFIVGIALSGFTLSEFLGGSPGTPGFASTQTLMMSLPTALIVIILSLFGRGMLRSFAFLIALIAGDFIALLLGRIEWGSIADKAWFGLPQLLPYGPLELNWPVFLTFFIAYIAAVIEAMGVYQAAAQITDADLNPGQIRRGFAGEAAGSAVSTLFGGFPTTAYGQNVGLLRLTRIGSRYPVMVAGALFLVLGFIPKAGAVLALTPSPVIGGIFLPAAASLIFTGLSGLMRMERTDANFMIAGLSILLAISLPAYGGGFPGMAGTLLSNSVIVGAASAIILHLILIDLPRVIQKGES